VVKKFTVKTPNREKHSHYTGLAEACPSGKAYKLFSKYEPVPALDVFFSEVKPNSSHKPSSNIEK
jgi:hypothetical protein